VDASGGAYISSASTLSYSDDSTIIPQAGAEMTYGGTTAMPATTFSDFNSGYVHNVSDYSDTTYDICQEADLDLGKFFERPILIASINWGVGNILQSTIDPWVSYLNSPRVANRITNYKNLRAQLHLKFVINGNPFYYGHAIAHLVPLPLTSHFAPINFSHFYELIPASQNPHIYLDPTTSEGGELVVPFLYPYNAFDLPTGNYAEAAAVVIRDMSPLAHANGGNQPISISVFAWLTDVKLSGLTSHNIFALVPQGGDEYGTGIVSDKAQAVAAAMAKIESPSIKPYARATGMIAETVAGVARMFGYSRPNSIDPTKPMAMHPYGNLANTNLGDDAIKLTLDAKQELTIDPRTIGVTPDDEMSLRTLAMKESFITKFGWSSADTVGTDLHYHVVKPTQFGLGAIDPSSGIRYYPTPAAWVAAPFEFWRGSMMFRFKVIASSFHKGRLRISYDPTYSQSVDTFNVVQNYVVDIAENKEFCLKVGWNQPQSYATITDFTATLPWGALPIVVSPGLSNGTLKVEVLNELTSPITGATTEVIEVLVFASMCDDFEVQSPNSGRLSTLMFLDSTTAGAGLMANEESSALVEELEMVPQAGMDIGEDNTGMTAPCDNMEDCAIAPPLPVDETPGIYFGEMPSSWRQCLKRYNFHSTSTIETAVGAGVLNLTRPNIPNYRGPTINGVHRTSTGVPYNYSDMTLLNWVMPAYLGVRGGIRYKYAVANVKTGGIIGTLHAVRSAGKPGWSESVFGYATAPFAGQVTDSSEASFFFRKYWSHTWAGANTVPLTQNSVLAIEVPFQDTKRFWNARRTDYDVANTEVPGFRVDLCYTATCPMLHQYVAVGDDFSCFMFVNAPPFYVKDIDPNPATTP